MVLIIDGNSEKVVLVLSKLMLKKYMLHTCASCFELTSSVRTMMSYCRTIGQCQIKPDGFTPGLQVASN